MINQATNYLPVQQTAVQQQMQQGTAPVVQQLQTVPPKAPEYNAIKIDILKPQVQTAQDPVYSIPFNPIYTYPPSELPESQAKN